MKLMIVFITIEIIKLINLKRKENKHNFYHFYFLLKYYFTGVWNIIMFKVKYCFNQFATAKYSYY